MSRWSHWSRGTNPPKMLSDFLKEGPVDATRSANPTGNGQLSPADRARQLGLQSNGKGGYIDPQTGQTVARTVNNELVFYSAAPGGGAVSDGSGGSVMANPSTAWQDPISGLMTTPPGQPESPNELAAVPDPVPAQAPAGYNAFINKKKQEVYAQDKAAREQPPAAPEMDPDAQVTPDQAMAEPQAVPAMENFLPNDLLKRTGGMGPPTFSDLRDRMKRSQIGQQQISPPDAGSGGGQSLAQRMAQADLSQVPQQNQVQDGSGEKLSDLIQTVRSGGELSPEQQEEIANRRRALRQGAPSSPGATHLSAVSRENLSQILKSTPDHEDDGIRRADKIWEQKHETELPGESATLQAIHLLLNNEKYQGIQQHLDVKPGSDAFKELPKEVQETIKEYHDEISDVLPSSHLNGAWQFASAKAAKLIRDELGERFPEGIPRYNLMKPYDVGGGANAMRLTNIPPEFQDDTYSELYNRLGEYIGGENQLRKVVKGAKGSSVRDNHDATDITLLQEGMGQQMMEEFQTKLDELGFDASDGLTDEEIRTAVRALNDLKAKYDDSGALRNISLKQIQDNKPGTYEKKPSVNDMPEVSFDSDNFKYDFGFGSRRIQPERGGRFVDSLDFNNQGVNLPFLFGDRTLNLPLIPHPGSSDKKRGTPATMSHDPYGTLGSMKSEPTMSGKGGKLGAIPSYTWFDETLDSYIPGGFESLGSGSNFGSTVDNKIRGLDDNDRQRFMDMIEAAQNHQGNIKFNGAFNFMGEDMEPGDWFDRIKELDDLYENGKLLDRDYDDGEEDEYTQGDKARDFISKETRQKLREKYGSLPLSQIRQKIRRKMGGMMALRLFQMLEGQGGDAMQRFIRDKIYVPGMKIDDMNSPGRIIA